ncbi:hypothetical protein EHS25_007481 [Saitozyma podzolica]|uniref:Apple domain-containing protein n=1 Tax=Saitozyma podzolica TaxID=1890683 RepID=A0A427YPU4_9TREE|nr:hypothetical protein EHS25_007481 [Saitozyma podzolica]
MRVFLRVIFLFLFLGEGALVLGRSAGNDNDLVERAYDDTTVTSSRSYAVFHNGWDNAYNDLIVTSGGNTIGPSISGITSFQNCINECNTFQATYGSECYGVSYDTGQDICWLKGSAISQYTYQTKANTIAAMIGTCTYWTTSSTSPELVSGQMAEGCQDLTGS